MSDGDRQTSIGNGLPRLTEISRAITRGIRGLADAAGAPSFADALADASVAVNSDAPSAPSEQPTAHGGRRSGAPADPLASLPARRGQDRAAGAVAALAPLSPPPVQARPASPLPPSPGLPPLPLGRGGGPM